MSNLRYVSTQSLYYDEVGQKEFIYIADTNNHCIKQLCLLTNEVTVIAGKCGTSGFMDGPLGYSKLNKPSNLGVSRKGVIYFFDEGN